MGRFLHLHPDVFWVPRVEMHYFDRDYDRGLTWYRSWFDRHAVIEAHERRTGRPARVGEKTPAYLALPDGPAPRRRRPARCPPGRVSAGPGAPGLFAVVDEHAHRPRVAAVRRCTRCRARAAGLGRPVGRHQRLGLSGARLCHAQPLRRPAGTLAGALRPLPALRLPRRGPLRRPALGPPGCSTTSAWMPRWSPIDPAPHQCRHRRSLRWPPTGPSWWNAPASPMPAWRIWLASPTPGCP